MQETKIRHKTNQKKKERKFNISKNNSSGQSQLPDSDSIWSLISKNFCIFLILKIKPFLKEREICTLVRGISSAFAPISVSNRELKGGKFNLAAFSCCFC